MASGPEHYRTAEQLLTRAADVEIPEATYLLMRAQVHAELAKAAATIDVGMGHAGEIRNGQAWVQAVKRS